MLSFSGLCCSHSFSSIFKFFMETKDENENPLQSREKKKEGKIEKLFFIHQNRRVDLSSLFVCIYNMYCVQHRYTNFKLKNYWENHFFKFFGGTSGETQGKTNN